jgi:tripartite-type tricarboxylate transporter receptor subunit TctC
MNWPNLNGDRTMNFVSRFLLLLISGITFAHAQSYPARPVRIVVGFAAGGPADIVARIIAQQLTERFGSTFLVENRPGATGTIGAGLVSKAASDGYTLYLPSVNHVMAPYMYSKVPYDPVTDFSPVARVAHNPLLVVVHPSLPVKSIKDLIALAKARPGELNFATGGIGASTHLAAELFKSMVKIDMVAVHYKGDGAAYADLAGGQIRLMFASISGLLPYVRSGKLRGIAVTSAKRSQIAPEFPTVAESGLSGYEVVTWFGVLAPPATPKDIVTRLNHEILQSLALPSAREQFTKLGFEIVGNSPEQFAAYLEEENAKWSKVVKELGLRAE